MSTHTVAALAAVSAEDLWSIVEQVWESLLGAAVEPRNELDECTPDALISAEVRLTGAWTGAVAVCAPRRAAEEMAATMLGLPDGEPLEDLDVEDAFGEVVNVLGGSIKALLPAPSVLSLPSVTAGEVDTAGDAVRRVVAGWAGSGVEVTVRAHDEHTPSPDGGTESASTAAPHAETGSATASAAAQEQP